MYKMMLASGGLLFLVLFFLGPFKMSSAQEKASGTLGDVKYSILDPDKFAERNGKGWVLLDGRTIEGSDLAVFLGMKSLPDARGVFIRGMNLKRKPEEGDSGGDRLVGSYQKDMFLAHNHRYSDAYFAENNCGNAGLLGSRASDTDNGRCTSPQTTENKGDAETSPRNITLYIYIKISE